MLEQIVMAGLAIAIVMLLLWVVQLRTRDAGVVDVAWSAAIGLVAIYYAVTSPGDPTRRLLLAIVAPFWGLRLALYLLANRVLGKQEDGRYSRLREKWGPRAQLNFLLFFEFQAALVVLFSLPALAVAYNPSAGLNGWDIAGAVLLLASVLGESAADRQLAAFRANRANRGRTCRNGLWRFSRHPNYFFEWLHWWAYVLLGIGSPLWWMTLAGPLLMWIFLFKITGIPATEEQALATRGEDYRRYQATTSQFIPWFPREEKP